MDDFCDCWLIDSAKIYFLKNTEKHSHLRNKKSNINNWKCNKVSRKELENIRK